MHAVVQTVKYYLTIIFADYRITIALLAIFEEEKLIEFEASIEVLIHGKVNLRRKAFVEVLQLVDLGAMELIVAYHDDESI